MLSWQNRTHACTHARTHTPCHPRTHKDHTHSHDAPILLRTQTHTRLHIRTSARSYAHTNKHKYTNTTRTRNRAPARTHAHTHAHSIGFRRRSTHVSHRLFWLYSYNYDLRWQCKGTQYANPALMGLEFCPYPSQRIDPRYCWLVVLLENGPKPVDNACMRLYLNYLCSYSISFSTTDTVKAEGRVRTYL